MTHRLIVVDVFLFFKQKTAYEMRISDWSSDVCSSDLLLPVVFRRASAAAATEHGAPAHDDARDHAATQQQQRQRTEPQQPRAAFEFRPVQHELDRKSVV